MTAPLETLIRAMIAKDGPISLADYMNLCLCHPAHGYYMTRDPFGAAGDFTTAPEISQLFGEMIGIWLADSWIKLGQPSDVQILECGPGRGALMADALRATKHVEGFHEALHLNLMEISPVLRARQKEALGQYDPAWIDDLSALPEQDPVLIVGNEFLDALPIHQFSFKDGAWWERCIGLDQNDTLCFIGKKADEELLLYLAGNLRPVPANDVIEASLILNQFLKSVSNILKKQKGAALFIDYGYVRTSPGETLQAVRSHRFVSVFDTPGHSDLTAHVDFENIARVARAEDIFCHGPVTQNTFLKSLGIAIRADQLSKNATPDQQKMIHAGLDRLVNPDQMGTLFKVAALCHDPSLKLAGF